MQGQARYSSPPPWQLWWQGQPIPTYWNPLTHEVQALIPVDPLLKPGSYPLRLQQNEGGTPKASEPLVLQRWQVSVTASQFGRQDIHVSKGAKGLEASAEESRLIELWKTTHTAELSPDLQNLPWAVPVPQCMNSPFGVKRFYDGVFSGNYHKGVDQKAPHGQAIHPITAGRVVMAGRYPLHGGAVALDHGSGVGSIYIHMSKVSVKVGQHVTPETVLGLVGSTGFAMGPHLHWGLYVQGVPVNPTDGWVRLKSC